MMVTAVPPEKSIPGVTGIPVAAMVNATITREMIRNTSGITTSCCGEYFSIL
jgi:hypothetical protein